MKVLQKCAEILVESGYADIAYGERLVWIAPEVDHITDICNPFVDTLEGRKQADAIEDWLIENKHNTFEASKHEVSLDQSMHMIRLDRIKWCIQELIK